MQDNYKLTCKKIEERFECKDLPNVIRRQLQELRHFPGESLEEYAECAQDLAVDGFSGTSDDFIQIVATDAFLKDKREDLTAMYKDPEKLDRAVKFVKSAMNNQRVIVGIKKTDVNSMTFQETEIEDCDPDDDHQASACLGTIYRQETYSTMGKFEARLKRTKEDLKETRQMSNRYWTF